MKLVRLFAPFALLCVTAASHAQVGSSITFFGSLSLSEGGTGTAIGQASHGLTGFTGGATFTFSEGPVSDLRITQVTDYSAPGSTAFFGGPAVAIVRSGARSQKVAGRASIMVDDLTPSNLPFPDQIFIRFDSNDGRVLFIRHGVFTRGDVRIAF